VQAAAAAALATKAAAEPVNRAKIAHLGLIKHFLEQVALLVGKVVRRARLAQVLTVLQRGVAEAARAFRAQAAAPAAQVAKTY
jgi:hypothetical protein